MLAVAVVIRLIVIVTSLLYPLIIYFGIAHLNAVTLAGLLMTVVLLRVLLGDLSSGGKLLALCAVCVAFGLHWWMRDDVDALRFYPVIINASLMLTFGSSLFTGLPLIESIARKRNMNVGENNIRYLRKLTFVWTLFFGVSVIVSMWTAIYASMEIWLFYNGFVSYGLVGLLVAGELVVRYFYRRRNLATKNT